MDQQDLLELQVLKDRKVQLVQQVQPALRVKKANREIEALKVQLVQLVLQAQKEIKVKLHLIRVQEVQVILV